MSRKKSTKRALEAIAMFQEQLKHYELCIKIKSYPIESQPSWYQDKSLEYFEGWITGILSVVENIIHKENSWKGFHYVDSNGEWLSAGEYEYITKHPEYRNFRVQHFGA